MRAIILFCIFVQACYAGLNQQIQAKFYVKYPNNQFTLELNNKKYTLVRTRELRHGDEANLYCQMHFTSILARIPEREIWGGLSSALMSIQKNQDVELREVGIGERTALRENEVPLFPELNMAGRYCAVLGAWSEENQDFSGDHFKLLSKGCAHQRYFLCEESTIKAVTFEHDAFTLGYNNHKYTLVQTRKLNHGGLTNTYCNLFFNQRLAVIEDEATLNRLSTQLMRVQTNTGYPMREIGTGMRTSKDIDSGVATIDDLNAGGRQCVILGAWNTETEDFSGDKFNMLVKSCNHYRTFLCEDYDYCAAGSAGES